MAESLQRLGIACGFDRRLDEKHAPGQFLSTEPVKQCAALRILWALVVGVEVGWLDLTSVSDCGSVDRVLQWHGKRKQLHY